MRFQLSLLAVSIMLVSCQVTKSKPTTIRPNIDALAKAIAKYNVLESSAIGEAGTRSKQWERFLKLSNKATTKELIELTSHPNGVVKCYSFQALALRKNIDLIPILNRHLTDTTTVESISGCLFSTEMVGDCFIDIVTPEYNKEKLSKLSFELKQTIDSILIFKKEVTLATKYNLLSNIKPKQSYHSRIREICENEKSPQAALALARFQNKGDIPIIEGFFKQNKTEYYAMYAAKEFPDEAFYPYLVNIFNREWKRNAYDYPKWRILYQALAKYPRQTTVDLFEKTINTKDEFRHCTLTTNLVLALKKYPNEIFATVLNKVDAEQINYWEIKNLMNQEN